MAVRKDYSIACLNVKQAVMPVGFMEKVDLQSRDRQGAGPTLF